MVVKVLFVCTGNMDRSPTAESLLKGRQGFEVTSAGTWTHANRIISKDLIDWADVIFAMELEHKEAILGICPGAEQKVVVLNVPNMFSKNDPELVKILKDRLSGYLKVDW